MPEKTSQDILQSSNQSSQAKAIEPEKIEGQKLADNIQLLEAARLAAKKDELAVIERRIDDKLVELKKFVELTKTQGDLYAGQNQAKTKEQIEIDECNRLLEGTGLKI